MRGSGPPSRPAARRRRSLRRRGGVRERAQHPRDVAERRALPAPLGERARGLALEVEDQPVLLVRPERLAEVVVAVRADHAADGADVREQAQVVAHLLAAAPRSCSSAGMSGSVGEDVLDLLVDRRGEERERLGARLLGSEVRVGRVGPERVVQQRRHLAEPARVLRQPVGLAARACRAPAPSRRPRGHEPLHGRQRRLEGPALVGDVALERRDMLEAALGEEAEHLELRVHPRLDPAVELQRERSSRTTELFDCSTPIGRASGGRGRSPVEQEASVASSA